MNSTNVKWYTLYHQLVLTHLSSLWRSLHGNTRWCRISDNLIKWWTASFHWFPDPSVILSSVPPEASTFFFHWTIRLAFFSSVPLHPDCRNLFSFSYKGTQYTYNRNPPGFCEKPFDLQPCPPEWPKRCSIPWRKHYGSTCWSPFDLFDNSRNLQRLKPSTC